MSRIDPYIGILLLDSRFNPENEIAVGLSGGSSYDQSGPVPGQAVPDDDLSLWKPAIVGAQSANLGLQAIRGGFPGRDGASVIYREYSSSRDTDWRGWDEPNTVASWSAPESGYSAATSWDQFTAVTLPSSQSVIVAALEFGGGLRIFRLDPRSETWEDGFYFDPGDGWSISNPAVLAWDAVAGRLLLFTGFSGLGDPQQLAFFSDDEGDTWTLYAQGNFPGGTGPASIATQPREAWLCIRETGSATQYSSIDAGQTWDRVGAVDDVDIFHSAPGRQYDIVALPGGGYLLVYCDEANSGRLQARRVPTADTPIPDCADTQISETEYESVTACVDADGVVYIFAVQDATHGAIDVFRSLDEGVTFAQYDWGLFSGGPIVTVARPVMEFAVAAGGRLHVGHTAHDGTLALDPWGVFHVAGWSTVESGSGAFDEASRTGRVGGGDYVGAHGVAQALSFVPIDEPGNLGWSASGAGTYDLSTGPWLEITTAANLANNRMEWAIGASSIVRGSAELAPGITGVGYQGVGLHLYLTDGGSGFSVQLRFTTTRITAYDTGGSAEIAHLDVAVTAGVRIRFMLTMDGAGGGLLSLWCRSAGEVKWTVICDADAVSDAGGGFANVGEWGHIENGTATSRWGPVVISPWGDWQAGIDTDLERAGADVSVYTLGHLGLSWGHPMPASSTEAYPLPDATSTSEDVGRIAARGRAHKAETATAPAAYVHGMRQACPVIAPSPSRFWESASSAAQVVVYDLGRPQWVGGGIGLVVLNAEGRTWVLECDNGAGGWQTVGTLDLAIGADLLGTVTGSVLVPRSGTDAVDDFLGEGRLVGGYAICSTAGDPVARAILRSSGGYWSDDAELQRVRLTLSGADGTEAASNTCTLVQSGGVLVVYPPAELYRRRWRVSTPADQVTPSGKVKAGVIGIGRIAAIGAEPGWDWSRRLGLRRIVSRDRSGTPSVRRTGSPAETWSYAWPDVVDLREPRSGAAARIATAAGLPIGSAEDAWHSLFSFLEHELESGEMPAVLLPALPLVDTTLRDPLTFLYGTLMTEEFGASGISGREGQSEIVRLDSLSFEELPS